MATTDDELREQLVAAIEAAPELAKEDRQHLADVFLDQLNARYDLIPRGSQTKPQPVLPAGRPPWHPRWVPFALLFAFIVFVLPAAFHHHAPIVLFLALAIFLALKSGVLGVRRRGPSWRW